jgi:hypothetical protein
VRELGSHGRSGEEEGGEELGFNEEEGGLLGNFPPDRSLFQSTTGFRIDLPILHIYIYIYNFS